MKITVSNIDIESCKAEKDNFKHFMLKEIYDQPETIEITLKEYLKDEEHVNMQSKISRHFQTNASVARVLIIGCGTSWHAALIGKYLFEEYAGIAVEAEYASEFRYRKPVFNKNDVVILISQSGETADTLAALRLARKKGVMTLAVCNVAGSTIAREADDVIFTKAGAEIGVASTKAFTAQVTVLSLFAFKLAKIKGTISAGEFELLVKELTSIPSKIRDILKDNFRIRQITKKYKNAENFLYLGRGLLFPVALEGALKLKEISYIHAEGYAAGEIKHGPIALIDKNMPVVVIAPRNAYYEKIVNSIREVKARKGKVIAVVAKGEHGIKDMCEDIIEIPGSHPSLLPLLAIVPLQLLAYHIAELRRCNIDQPRNLAKSVTVE